MFLGSLLYDDGRRKKGKRCAKSKFRVENEGREMMHGGNRIELWQHDESN